MVVFDHHSFTTARKEPSLNLEQQWLQLGPVRHAAPKVSSIKVFQAGKIAGCDEAPTRLPWANEKNDLHSAAKTHGPGCTT